ncbi:MGH1-like glycoside hydrolase domain-containing protein [Persicobacter diffluens]|uniref:Glucosidase n=1 Tax=Persicobacter diffluens TaxID=981 RepID=A0AAN5ALT6_9BACT|nr:glucosidase [Persicobacter diffluens]
MDNNKESQRLKAAYEGKSSDSWLYWGPYLSERQWGTVREDYSADGNAWDYFSHDQARSRAYRWGEDGLAGISDPEQRLCFSLAMWNGNDPILKERLFGLTNSEGNHGEDVKEYYYYLDNTPTHSYMKWQYKYPQRAFPYDDLVAENGRRKADPHSMEYELMDTGVFEEDRYFDVQAEYAKGAEQDIFIKITVKNQGPEAAGLVLLPTLWFRNTWSWYKNVKAPEMFGEKASGDQAFAKISTSELSDGGPSAMTLYCQGAQDLLFVENETNNERLWGVPNATRFPKDGINDFIVHKQKTVNPDLQGTKASAAYYLKLEAGGSQEVWLRLSDQQHLTHPFDQEFSATFEERIQEADAFYEAISPIAHEAEAMQIQRQAYAGMLWSKQYYNYVVADWLNGDPAGPPPPEGRGRNMQWSHMYASNVLSMPDAWEYPWFAAWDLCFQAVVFARLDLEFAKNQLRHLANEWYMSPGGAIPAYEWSFSDVNPPLHAWASLKIFEIEKAQTGKGDFEFLADIFRHCLINFTWWVNQVDADDNNLFEGGFLGLDNISILNRSNLADFENRVGHRVVMSQSDGTSWVGMFCLKMMEMALILSETNSKEYSHLVSKFFQHFVFIADAMNGIEHRSKGKVKLWNEEDGFYYDFLTVYDNPVEYYSVKLRSLVGVIALFPVASLDLSALGDDCANEIKEKIDWFLGQHPELIDQVKTTKADNENELLLSFVNPDRLKRILSRLLSESEFLSPHGIRGISKDYEQNPFYMEVDGIGLSEQYAPAESLDQSFGGNSNWRGPVWFPINFLLIETLRQYHTFLGHDFQVEYPSGSRELHCLEEIATDLSKRLIGIFQKDENGNRPVFGGNQVMQQHPDWNQLLFFYEYFHGDNGAGLGASHQTGWTGLVAELLNQTKVMSHEQQKV